MSPSQRDVLSLTQRYDAHGDHLNARQQELQDMLTAAKAYLEDVHEILTWLGNTEDTNEEYNTLPANVKDTIEKLQRHNVCQYCIINQ